MPDLRRVEQEKAHFFLSTQIDNTPVDIDSDITKTKNKIEICQNCDESSQCSSQIIYFYIPERTGGKSDWITAAYHSHRNGGKPLISCCLREDIRFCCFFVLWIGCWKMKFWKRPKTLKNDILGLKMIIFGHFSRFLAFFKISFYSLQHPNYNELSKWGCAAVRGLAFRQCDSTTTGQKRRAMTYLIVFYKSALFLVAIR